MRHFAVIIASMGLWASHVSKADSLSDHGIDPAFDEVPASVFTVGREDGNTVTQAGSGDLYIYSYSTRVWGREFGGLQFVVGPEQVRQEAGFLSTPQMRGHLSALPGHYTHLVAGYSWNRVTVAHSSSAKAYGEDGFRNESQFAVLRRTASLSYRADSDWVLRLARGRVSGLDALVGERGLRRTALSATVSRDYGKASMRTTIAWGRTSSRERESSSGYLMESSLSFGSHTTFGRVEQVTGDEMLRRRADAKARSLRFGKASFGYYREISTAEGLRMDVGGLVSKYLMSSSAVSQYEDTPTTYLMFVRFRFR